MAVQREVPPGASAMPTRRSGGAPGPSECAGGRDKFGEGQPTRWPPAASVMRVARAAAAPSWGGIRIRRDLGFCWELTDCSVIFLAFSVTTPFREQPLT